MKLLGREVELRVDEAESFFDDWIKQGAKVCGINKYGVKYVKVDAEIYYDLDDARHIALGIFDFVEHIHGFCPGISGDQIKDLRKLISK